jgi:hypothetical protein
LGKAMVIKWQNNLHTRNSLSLTCISDFIMHIKANLERLVENLIFTIAKKHFATSSL